MTSRTSRCSVSAILLFALASIILRAEDKTEAPALRQLHGSWTAIEAEADGLLIEDAAFWREKKTFKLTGSAFELVLADGTFEGTAQINAETNPSQITLVTKGDTELRGIYALKNDRLTLCWAVSIKDKRLAERPTGFATQKGEFKFVFKKDAAAPKDTPDSDKPENPDQADPKKSATKAKTSGTKKPRTDYKQLFTFKDEKSTKDFWTIGGKSEWRIQNDGIRFACGNRISGELRTKHEFAGDFLFEIKGTLNAYGSMQIRMFGEQIEFGGATKPTPIQVQVQRKNDTLQIKKNGQSMTIQLKEDRAKESSDVVVAFSAWDNRGTSLLVNSVGINAKEGRLKEPATELDATSTKK